jgi:hypothetical protein
MVENTVESIIVCYQSHIDIVYTSNAVKTALNFSSKAQEIMKWTAIINTLKPRVKYMYHLL